MLVKREMSAPLGKSAEIDSGSYFDEVLLMELGLRKHTCMETGGWWHAESSGRIRQWPGNDGSGSPYRCRSL